MSLFTGSAVIVLGLIVLGVLVVQILIGLRKIKFKGRTHLKVHRWVAYAMLALALVHGFAALVLFGYIRL